MRVGTTPRPMILMWLSDYVEECWKDWTHRRSVAAVEAALGSLAQGLAMPCCAQSGPPYWVAVCRFSYQAILVGVVGRSGRAAVLYRAV